MSALQLTKTMMRKGVWQGILTQSGDTPPQIEVTHLDKPVADVAVTHDAEAGHWNVSIPIPPEAVADGVHTLLIMDKATGEKIGHDTLIAGEVVGDDMRAEVDLLRAELDMLKRAFRRHCLETM